MLCRTVPGFICTLIFQKPQWLHFQALLNPICSTCLGSPPQHCAAGQAGQGEAIIKPCFLEMLSIARSDYGTGCLIIDEPCRAHAVCAGLWELLASAGAPMSGGPDTGGMESMQGVCLFGSGWQKQICVVVRQCCACSNLLDGSALSIRKAAAALAIMSNSHFTSLRRGLLTSAFVDTI